MSRQETTLPDTSAEAVERLAKQMDRIAADYARWKIYDDTRVHDEAAATLRALRAERDAAWQRVEAGDRRASSLDSDLLALGHAIQQLHKVAVTAGAIGPAARPFAEASDGR